MGLLAIANQYHLYSSWCGQRSGKAANPADPSNAMITEHTHAVYVYIELPQPLEFLKTLSLLRRLVQGAGIGLTVCAEIVEVSRKFIHP